MYPISRETVKSIASIVPGVFDSLASNRKRIPKDVTISTIASILSEHGYKGEALELAKKRMEDSFKIPFGEAKSYPKDRLADEVHHILNFLHLAPFMKTFVFVDNLTEDITYREIEVNTTLTSEEIQDILPTKVTQEKFERILKDSPYQFSLRWYKTLFTPMSRLAQFEKIYANIAEKNLNTD